MIGSQFAATARIASAQAMIRKGQPAMVE